jgi:hypothetical protein
VSARAGGRVVALEVRAYYSVAELARVVGVAPYKLLRLMRRCRIEFIHAGRSFYVPLSEIRDKIPALWRGICAAEDLRRGVDEAEPKTPRPQPVRSRA